MAFGDGAIPRGIDDMKVYVLDASDVPGSAIDVPGIRALNFNVESDSDTLEGDNTTIAIARDAKRVTGSVELGKLEFDALGAFTGNSATTSGTSPNQILTLEESAQAPSQYVQIVGQAPDRGFSGGGYRVTIYKALVTSGPDESMTVNEWSTPTLDFEASENASGNLLKRESYETYTAIT